MNIPETFVLNNKTYYIPKEPDKEERASFYFSSCNFFMDLKNYLSLNKEQYQQLKQSDNPYYADNFSIKELLNFISQLENVIDCNVFWYVDDGPDCYISILKKKTEKQLLSEQKVYQKALKIYQSLYEKNKVLIESELKEKNELKEKKELEDESKKLDYMIKPHLSTVEFKQIKKYSIEKKKQILETIKSEKKNFAKIIANKIKEL